MRGLVGILALALGLAACTLPTSGPANIPGDSPAARSEERHDQVDEVLVALDLAGGGVRAAALAYGTMQEMSRIAVPGVSGRPSTLLREVDYLTAVSGGAFTAAYYAIHRDIPAAFAAFPDRFLHVDHEARIAQRKFTNPWIWLKLGLTDFTQSDLAARYNSATLFDDKPFSALPAHPRVILTARDLTTGSRFEFTAEFFRCLGSSLSPYPIGHAVTAASTNPIRSPAIVLTSFGAPRTRCLSAAEEAELRSHRPGSESRLRAARKERYLDGRVRFIHLVDAGMTSRATMAALIGQIRHGELGEQLRRQRVRGLVVIAVDAGQPQPAAVGARRHASPALRIDTALDDLREETNAPVQSVTQTIGAEVRGAEKRLRRRIPVHVVEIRIDDLQDASRRSRLLATPAGLALEPGVVADLIAAGRALLYCGGGHRSNAATLGEIVAVFHRHAGKPKPRGVVALPANLAC